MCYTINISSIVHLHSWLTTSIHTLRQNTNDDGFFVLAAFTSLRTHSPKSGMRLSQLLSLCTTIAGWLNGGKDWLAPDLGDARNLWQAVVTWHESSSNQRFPKSDSKEFADADVPVGEWVNMGLETIDLSADEEDVLFLDVLLVNGP